MWLVSPEVRWYLLDGKRFYVGVGGNYGEYNIYKGMVGDLFSDDTGYQGKLWNAGAVVGYQLKLSRAFSLDFNLGLGYTHFEYDSFNVINEVRVYKDRDKTKNFWGPTQAGISLIWTLGK
jgi:hemolysin activation/secretion protein